MSTFTKDGATVIFRESYGEIDMVLEQVVATSSAGVTVAHPPLRQLVFYRIFARLDGIGKTALETFFNSSAQGMANQFDYLNPVLGFTYSVYFAEPILPQIKEVGHGQYKCDLLVRQAGSYVQSETTGISMSASGNRFTLDNISIAVPIPLRAGYGLESERLQTYIGTTSITPVVYEKSVIFHRHFTYPVILTQAQFFLLKSFLFQYAHGQQKPFIWTDAANVSRTVRLGANRVTFKQLGANRYSVDLPLIEEVPL